MRKMGWPVVITVVVTVAMVSVGCSSNNASNDGTNNGASNNGASNNGGANNAGSNNGGSNNGATNNGGANNGATNNGATNNGTANTTNNDTTTNNATTGTNNQTGGTNNSTVGPFASCGQGGLEECFYNDDCEATERCEDVGPGGTGPDAPPEVACCVMGARGTKTVGEACTSENDCDTGLCIARNDDPSICSKTCEGPDDCPEDLECHGALGLCVTM